jgi:CHRD domain
MRRSRLIAGLATVAIASGVGFTLSGIAGAEERDSLRAELTGAQEVPPADPDGSARGSLRIDVDDGEVCFAFKWHDIGTPTLGHIHNAPAGVNGPIVVGLLDGFTPDELEQDDDARACVSADPALLADIVANPDQYYLNIHNARFPGGAVRGQLG